MHDLNKVGAAAQVQEGIDRYHAQAKNMSFDDFTNEKHSSRRLGRNMTKAGDPRPHPRCDAHAIVSGGHYLAMQIRAILAWCEKRIDNSINGAWLPRGEADKPHMPPYLRNAAAHNRIHRNDYYRWMNLKINPTSIQSKEDLERELKIVKWKLQSGTIPSHITPKLPKA